MIFIVTNTKIYSCRHPTKLKLDKNVRFPVKCVAPNAISVGYARRDELESRKSRLDGETRASILLMRSCDINSTIDSVRNQWNSTSSCRTNSDGIKDN